MTFLLDILGLLGLRSRSVGALAARTNLWAAFTAFAAGFLVFVLVRNAVYAGLREAGTPASLLERVVQLNLIQATLYFALVCIPVLAAGVALTRGESPGFSLSVGRYRTHLSVLFPLWGVLFAVSAPVQALVPHWIVLGEVGISVGLLSLFVLAIFYTAWAVGRINGISMPAAAGVVLIAVLTLPVFYLLAGTTLAPLSLLVGAGICFVWNKLRVSRTRP